jgi:3-oxoacyl-[acyl-carrier protein] reductase
MIDLSGRVALVTGASRGIGRAIAGRLASQGAVVLAAARGDNAAGTVQEIEAACGRAEVVALDVTDAPAVDAAIASAIERHGRIDILVNNAGIGSEAPLDEITEQEFDRMFAVHVKGSFFATQAVVPGMKARRTGKIINISSIWGMVGHHAASDYCGAKAALLGLTRAWARELAPWNIHVNAVAPGGVLTEMVLRQPNIETRMADKIKLVPLGRYADPSEIAATVAFLASSEADFITGQVISPNGGQTIVGI